MGQVSYKARKGYNEDIVFDIPTRVHIPGTRRAVRLTAIKPGTLQRLTRLWMERDEMTSGSDSASVLKDMCEEPFFAIKEAAILVLNSYWKIMFLYPLKWRIWAYLYQYTEAQVQPIIQEGKKKLPLEAHWNNMVFSVDMRTDWMKMTKKEAEQYRAELLSAASQPSSRSIPATGASVTG